MLFYSVFKPSTEKKKKKKTAKKKKQNKKKKNKKKNDSLKSLNIEGPLSSYLWWILPSILITWSKESKQGFLPGEKKIFLSPVYFLNSCYSYVPLSFVSKKYLISFCKSIFDFLLLLIVFLIYFSRLLMPIDRCVCGYIQVWWDNHPKCLSCSSC